MKTNAVCFFETSSLVAQTATQRNSQEDDNIHSFHFFYLHTFYLKCKIFRFLNLI